jgi:hypothetical protein
MKPPAMNEYKSLGGEDVGRWSSVVEALLKRYSTVSKRS